MVCEFLEWSRRIVTFAFFRLVDLDCMFRMDRVVLVVWLGGDVGGLGSVGVLGGVRLLLWVACVAWVVFVV